MKKLAALMIVYSVILSVFAYKGTAAFFADSAASTNNTFTASSEFPTTPTPTGNETTNTTPGKIVINEVSSDGESNTEWVELFNSGGSSVSLSGWSIEDNNSSDSLGSASIPAGGYAVVVASGSAVSGIPGTAQTIVLSGPTIGNGLAETGDLVRLLNSTVTMDQMSYGTDTSVFPTPPAAPAAGQTLKRSPNGVDTDTAADWIKTVGNSIGAANL